MRALVRVAGILVGAVVLAGCGGDGKGGAGSTSPRPGGGTASAAPAKDRALSRDTVRRDVRVAAAAGGFDRLDSRGRTSAACRMIAAALPEGAPDPAAVAKVVAELRAQGWEKVFRKPEDGDVTWFLTRGNWSLYVFARADAGSTPGGLTFSGLRLDCSTPAATGSP
ncbi:hypothetical protein AB0F07_30855 [Streptomyces fructofermentans]|uniref:hypothetical protein n=1 Tax=Streptomyces fructofermentans TaxID=152141 RepID=UPI0033CCBE9C